jgi:hypothetical protein
MPTANRLMVGDHGVADRVWTIGEFLGAALATQPTTPTATAPDRRRKLRVTDGGKEISLGFQSLVASDADSVSFFVK